MGGVREVNVSNNRDVRQVSMHTVGGKGKKILAFGYEKLNAHLPFNMHSHKTKYSALHCNLFAHWLARCNLFSKAKVFTNPKGLKDWLFLLLPLIVLANFLFQRKIRPSFRSRQTRNWAALALVTHYYMISNIFWQRINIIWSNLANNPKTVASPNKMLMHQASGCCFLASYADTHIPFVTISCLFRGDHH